MGALLGDGKVDGAGQAFMSPQDVLLIHDGRVAGNAVMIKKEVKKVLKDKTVWGNRPSRCLCELRCLYHNREFMEGGLLLKIKKNQRNAVHSQSLCPEPLETVVLLQGREAKIDLKSRKRLDLPGDNSSKSMAGLSLKAEEARLISNLPQDCMTAMSQGEDFVAMTAGSEEDSAASGEEGVGEVPNQCLHPWEADETACRELLNCYAPPKGMVVDFWAGVSMATACCRDKVRYIGFVQNELTRSVLYEMVLLRIVLDMCLDTADGFTRAKRHLSRTDSLGGTQPAPSAPVVSEHLADRVDREEVLSDSGASE